jgi:hypothetical protein
MAPGQGGSADVVNGAMAINFRQMTAVLSKYSTRAPRSLGES